MEAVQARVTLHFKGVMPSTGLPQADDNDDEVSKTTKKKYKAKNFLHGHLGLIKGC